MKCLLWEVVFSDLIGWLPCNQVFTMVTWSIIDDLNQPHAGLLRPFIFSWVDRKPERLLNTHSENSTSPPPCPSEQQTDSERWQSRTASHALVLHNPICALNLSVACVSNLKTAYDRISQTSQEVPSQLFHGKPSHAMPLMQNKNALALVPFSGEPNASSTTERENIEHRTLKQTNRILGDNTGPPCSESLLTNQLLWNHVRLQSVAVKTSLHRSIAIYIYTQDSLITEICGLEFSMSGWNICLYGLCSV